MNEHSEQLERAVRSGDVSLVERLLRKHPGIVNQLNQDGELPIEMALACGVAFKDHCSALNEAEREQVATGNPAMVRCLLANGARLEQEGSSGISVIEDAIIDASYEDNIEPLRCLLEAGFDPDYLTNPLGVPLISRVAMNSLEATKLVLSYGPDVNQREDRGWTPLMFAAAFDGANHSPEEGTEIVRLLLKAGTDPLAQNADRSQFTARELAEVQSTADNPHNVNVIEILRQAECRQTE